MENEEVGRIRVAVAADDHRTFFGDDDVIGEAGGAQKLSDVLAVSRGSPSRVDVPLEAGRNAIIYIGTSAA